MKDIIKVSHVVISDEKVNSVDARELHAFLDSKQDFSTWVKARIKTYGFTEGVDFIQFHNFVESNTRARIDYTITLDMAKELSMVEMNAQGKQARKYFIECEKFAKSEVIKPATAVRILPEMDAALKLAKLVGLEGNQAMLCADKVVERTMGESPLALLGAPALIAEKQERHLTATELGKPLGLSAVKVNKLLIAAGIIRTERDSKNKLVYFQCDKGADYTVLLDTGKSHSDGTPVQQIKFYESARELLAA